MSVASQMLLNQVTIFNPPIISTAYSLNSNNEKSSYVYKETNNGKYSCGWSNPYLIYKQEKA